MSHASPTRRCTIDDAQRDLLEAHFRAEAAEPTSGGLPEEDLSILSLSELEYRLRAAVASERFNEAAKLRDEVQGRSAETEVAVLKKNAEFFAAWEACDVERMADLWHEGAHSCCIHAASKPVYGLDAIVDSWQAAFRKRKRKGRPEYSDHSVSVRENVARAVCCQVFKNGDSAVITNHFERTPDGWRLSCHQATTIGGQSEGNKLATLLSSVPEWIRQKLRERKEAAAERVEKEQRAKREALERLARETVPALGAQAS